jgi:membrane associated rhomboid family serine protease
VLSFLLNGEPSDFGYSSPMKFSLLRLMVAVLAIAASLGWNRVTGCNHPVIGAWISLAVAGIVLIAKRSDIRRVITSVFGAFLGVIAAGIFSPITSWPPGREYGEMMVGAYCGWMLACLLNRSIDRRSASRDRSAADSSDP